MTYGEKTFIKQFVLLFCCCLFISKLMSEIFAQKFYVFGLTEFLSKDTASDLIVLFGNIIKNTVCAVGKQSYSSFASYYGIAFI